MENKDIEIVEAEKVEAEVVEPVEIEAPAVETKKKANVLAILALVAGILGIIFNCCCYYISPVFAIAAIILAIIAPKKEDGKKTGLAFAGLILGIVTAVLFIGNILMIFLFPALGGILGILSGEAMY